MSMFSIVAPPPSEPKPTDYAEVMASVKDLAAKLDDLAKDYASRIAANNSEITNRQGETAVLTTKETEAKEMSAKLKALLPPEPAQPAGG